MGNCIHSSIFMGKSNSTISPSSVGVHQESRANQRKQQIKERNKTTNRIPFPVAKCHKPFAFNLVKIDHSKESLIRKSIDQRFGRLDPNLILEVHLCKENEHDLRLSVTDIELYHASSITPIKGDKSY